MKKLLSILLKNLFSWLFVYFNIYDNNEAIKNITDK